MMIAIAGGSLGAISSLVRLFLIKPNLHPLYTLPYLLNACAC